MLRISFTKNGISSSKRKYWSKQEALGKPKQYYLNVLKTTRMDAEDGQDYVYGFTNRSAMHSQKSLDSIRNNTNYYNERPTFRKAAKTFLPDFKRPDEPLLWEKQKWWQAQIKDEDDVPVPAGHHSRRITTKKILEQNNLNSSLELSWCVWNNDKPVFPWSQPRDLSNKMPIKSFDEQKEWRRYKLYHSQNWGSKDLIEKRKKASDRISRLDKITSEQSAAFSLLQKSISDSKTIEGSDETLEEIVQNFVILNIDDGLSASEQQTDTKVISRLSQNDKEGGQENDSTTTTNLWDEFSKEETKYWGKEETAEQLLERYIGEKTDFNFDLLYQIWAPKSLQESKDPWGMTNMRILNLNIEGAKGSLKTRNKDSRFFKAHSKAFIAMMDKELDDHFEPFSKRQKELRVMMNMVYKQRGQKAPYVIN